MIDRLDYPTPWPDEMHRGTPRDRTSARAECAAEALAEVRREALAELRRELEREERDLLLLEGAPVDPAPKRLAGHRPACPSNLTDKEAVP